MNNYRLTIKGCHNLFIVEWLSVFKKYHDEKTETSLSLSRDTLKYREKNVASDKVRRSQPGISKNVGRMPSSNFHF